MGYSIAIQCRSFNQQAMLQFMRTHYREGNKLFPRLPTRLHGPTEDLSYDHVKDRIGFDYGPGLSDPERHYGYSILAWMALKVGVRRAGRPAIRYDGDETWPIVTDGKAGKDDFRCDTVGYRTIRRGTLVQQGWLRLTCGMPLGQVDRTIRSELLRLNAEWDRVTHA